MNLFPIVLTLLILLPLVVAGLATLALLLIMGVKGISGDRLAVLIFFGTISGYLLYLLAKTRRPGGYTIRLAEGAAGLAGNRRRSRLLPPPFPDAVRPVAWFLIVIGLITSAIFALGTLHGLDVRGARWDIVASLILFLAIIFTLLFLLRRLLAETRTPGSQSANNPLEPTGAAKELDAPAAQRER